MNYIFNTVSQDHVFFLSSYNRDALAVSAVLFVLVFASLLDREKNKKQQWYIRANQIWAMRAAKVLSCHVDYAF